MPRKGKTTKGGSESKRHALPKLQDSAIEIHDPPAVQIDSSPSEDQREHRVHQHMHERRLRKDAEAARAATQKALISRESYCPPRGVNLRDVGAVTRGPMREGALFRSSELLSKEEMKKNQIKTILDLRRMDRPCKKEPGGNKAAESMKVVLQYLLLGPSRLIPEKRLLYVHRAHPQPCPLCAARAKRRYDQDIRVIHADLIPSTVGLRIFQSMPRKVQMKAIVGALTGKGAASVMAPAVANPLLLGYKALYKTLLEDSKRGMALALRPFVEVEKYPILVHCIHGKDRTGVIIMLLLMLCDVQPEAIVDDYMLSETVLKESRMHDELSQFDMYLTSDDVIAATRDTMEETIAYINSKYGGIREYLGDIGLEVWEIDKIRENLSRPDVEKAPFVPRLAPRFSIASIFPKRRHSGDAPADLREAGRAKTVPAQRLAHKKSCSLDSVPFTRDKIAATPEVATAPMDRRASVANSGAAEYREMMRRLREQHPELGPLTEERAVDLLRHSPVEVAQLATLPELDSATAESTPATAGQQAAATEPGTDRAASLGATASPTAVEVANGSGGVPNGHAAVEGVGGEVAESGVLPTREALARHRTVAHSFASSEEMPASPFAAVQQGEGVEQM